MRLRRPDAIRGVAAALNAQSGPYLPPAWTANLQAPAVSVIVSEVQTVAPSLCGMPRERQKTDALRPRGRTVHHELLSAII
jgi:hypothetical protein